MDNVSLNYAAILVAAVINMVLGSLWYSPLLFGNIWMKGVGLSKADMKKDRYMGLRYAVAFVMGLLMTYILAHYIGALEADTPSEGAEAGFWPWLGFIVPIYVGADLLWGQKPWSVFVINASYYLVVLLTSGILLASWQ